MRSTVEEEDVRRAGAIADGVEPMTNPNLTQNIPTRSLLFLFLLIVKRFVGFPTESEPAEVRVIGELQAHIETVLGAV